MSSISIPSCLTLARLNANGVINSVPHLQLPITVATPSHLSKRLRFFTVSREVKALAHNGIGITNSVPVSSTVSLSVDHYDDEIIWSYGFEFDSRTDLVKNLCVK